MENNTTVLDLEQLENVSGGSDNYMTTKNEPKYQIGQHVRFQNVECIVRSVYKDSINWIYNLTSGIDGPVFNNVFENRISPL